MQVGSSESSSELWTADGSGKGGTGAKMEPVSGVGIGVEVWIGVHCKKSKMEDCCFSSLYKFHDNRQTLSNFTNFSMLGSIASKSPSFIHFHKHFSQALSCEHLGR